ncbi:MAG: 4-hydroxy-tetrahydrodipicolinate reductase [Rhizobiaceae bacterium]|nr:4-hydroxy-tetrahydrodipicolinate reductase [Rhizobiaceae bacterium]
MADMRLVIVGAAGRMGQALVRAIADRDGAVVCGAVERQGSPLLGKDIGELAGTGPSGILVCDDPQAVFAKADGVIDFTSPAVSVEFAALTAQMGLVHVIGTTGLEAQHENSIARAAEGATIIKSGNMSLGVNLLSVLVQQAAKALEAADWDIEVLEMHHKHKVDAPSGTAYLLAKAAAQGRDIDLESHSVRVRDGQTGPREPGTIGFATLRGGSVVGEHSVILAGEGETVELTHRALDRTIFARGAIKAALWGQGRKPGLYSMLDVLGLS